MSSMTESVGPGNAPLRPGTSANPGPKRLSASESMTQVPNSVSSIVTAGAASSSSSSTSATAAATATATTITSSSGAKSNGNGAKVASAVASASNDLREPEDEPQGEPD